MKLKSYKIGLSIFSWFHVDATVHETETVHPGAKDPGAVKKIVRPDVTEMNQLAVDVTGIRTERKVQKTTMKWRLPRQMLCGRNLALHLWTVKLYY